MRNVVQFNSGTSKVIFDVGFTAALDNSWTYNIYKGCSKTWESCGATKAYGPTTNNTANFQGFLHLAGNVRGAPGEIS